MFSPWQRVLTGIKADDLHPSLTLHLLAALLLHFAEFYELTDRGFKWPECQLTPGWCGATLTTTRRSRYISPCFPFSSHRVC
ncbi:MAG: hypothetical protein CMJ70_18835 [Planctomycetaceae bacterium]|nr:hypothetical protein [Planctomycetaceae bacterium]HAA72774.1 hypothetical protein [Planctomycetaceae bacterium]